MGRLWNRFVGMEENRLIKRESFYGTKVRLRETGTLGWRECSLAQVLNMSFLTI